MKKLEQVSDIINKCVSYIGMVIFIVLIVACVAQVFFRFILNNSLSWSEELARYCFIWMHMLGASETNGVRILSIRKIRKKKGL